MTGDRRRSLDADPSIGFVDRDGHFHLYLQVDDVVAAADRQRLAGVRFERQRAFCDIL